MKTKFVRIALITVLCLTVLGRILPSDFCDLKLSHDKSVVAYNNASDLADSSDCGDCNCNCHHIHLDFALLTKAVSEPAAVAKVFSANSNFSLSPPALSLIKPPKIVS